MKKNIIKLLIILFIIIILSIILITFLNKKVVPIYMSYSKGVMKRVVTTVINKTVSDIEIGNDLFIIKETNTTEMASYDPIVLNKIISSISNNVYDNLKKIEDMDKNSFNKFNIDQNIFYIPTGIIFDSVMLNNIGPKIPVKLELIDSINSSIETKVTEYGINNSLIEVSVKVIATIRTILPISSDDMEVQVIVPIAVKIIQGNIPEYYFGGVNKKSS
ncbi:MAG: sporulation protein YunB [Bacilli bacterium]|nr:sporulation protein YunB [Bacilli bacterium]